MDFVSNQESQIKEMMSVVGISSIEELFQAIPKQLLLEKPSQDDGLSEFEAVRLMESIAAKNRFQNFDSYLGAGAYEHHVPAIVPFICSKSEFLTSYTPYQAEASQGMLQAIFEFQSAICALTGMDVSNASLYDGASACAEALLMALRCLSERKKVLIAESLNPHYRAVVDLYLEHSGSTVVSLPFDKEGTLQPCTEHMDENTAAILLQYPNFFGIVDDVKKVAEEAKKKGILVIICANPLVYGLYASAKELGADIAVGDVQPFGLPLQYGGPYAGYIACLEPYLRQLPGRIAGETLDAEGKRGFVLTLQAREQNIRREKATSNICTNQALAALASIVAMFWYGPKGMQELALTNFQRASYLKSELEKLDAVVHFSKAPIFNEFVIKFRLSSEKVLHAFREAGIEPGIHLGSYFSKLDSCFLVAVTETKSIEQLNRYIEVAKTLVKR